MKKIRVGIVGCGSRAQTVHLPYFYKDEEVDIIAVCDNDISKMEKIAEKYRIKGKYDDFKEFIKNKDMDAVVIATPNYLHSPMIMAALDYGKDVLSELPIAFDKKSVKRLIKKASSKDRILALSMVHRFRPDLQILKAMVDEKEIGNIRYSKTGWLRTQSSWMLKGWRGEYFRTGGGVFIQLGIHLLEIALWIMDKKPVSITGVSYSKDKYTDIEDTAFALLKFKDNSILAIEVGWSFSYDKEIVYFNLTGNKGIATLYPLKIHKQLHEKFVTIEPDIDLKNIYRDAYRNQVKTFVKAVKEKIEYPFTGNDALKCTSIIESFYKSVKAHKEIPIKT